MYGMRRHVNLAAKLAAAVADDAALASGTGCRGCVSFLLVEVVAQAGNASTREDAEDVALVVVKLRRGLSAVDQQLVTQEGLHAGQREVCELRAVVE